MQTSSNFQSRSRTNLAIERRYFAWLSTAILMVALFGFSRTYFLVPILGLPPDSLPPTPLVHAHAAIFFSWCVLLVVQSWLVASNRVVQHKQLGLLGLVLYCGLIVSGPLVALRSAVRYGATVDELAFLSVSLGNVLAYTSIFAAAFYWRRRPDIHKRLMLVGMVVLLTAPFGRFLSFPYQLPHVIGPGLVVIALAIWDRHAYGKAHFVAKYVGPAVLLWELLPNFYMNSAWWLAFSHWLVSHTS